MSVSTTKDIATRLISSRAINTKMISGQRPQLIKALFAAAQRLKEVPPGTRHIVLITDGVDSSGDSAALNEAIRQLFDANVTVHVIGYGALGRKKIDKQNPFVKITNKKRKSAKDIADEIMNPTQEPEYKKRNKLYLIDDLVHDEIGVQLYNF